MGFDFARVRQGITDNTNRNVRRLSNDIAENCVNLSRLDTGRTRRSWSASVDAPLPMNIDPITSGLRKSAARLNANTRASITDMNRAINAFDIRNDDFVFITNGVDYFARVWNNVDSTAINAIRTALMRSRG